MSKIFLLLSLSLVNSSIYFLPSASWVLFKASAAYYSLTFAFLRSFNNVNTVSIASFAYDDKLINDSKSALKLFSSIAKANDVIHKNTRKMQVDFIIT